MKSLPVALLVILVPCAAAGAPPIVSPELSMDQPVFGPAWKDQAAPAVAHDGKGGYLVVWADQRRTGSSSADIYAARVDSASKVLDRGGIRVSSSPGTLGAPAVTHNGKTFLVVWHSAYGKHGARVSAAGKVLDRPALLLSSAQKGSPNTDVAHAKGVYLVVWQESAVQYAIVGALVNSAGKLLKKVTLSAGSRGRRNPRVAGDAVSGTFLVVWQDYRTGKENHTYGARVDATGKVLDPGGQAISTASDGQYLPSVAHGGGSFLVVWHTNSDIRGARFTSDGKLLDPAGLDICVNKNIRMAPAVAYGGGKSESFLVVWKDFRNGAETDVFGTRVSAKGTVLETKGFGVSEAAGRQEAPRVAGGAKGFFAAWTDHRHEHEANIYGTGVTPAGKVQNKAGTLVSSAANHQAAPAVAHGDGYLVAWQDLRKGAAPTYRADIHGAQLSLAGKPQDPKGVSVSFAAQDELEPVVGHNGVDYLVAWRDRQEATGKETLLGALVLAAKVSKPLTLVAGQPQKLAPALAWGKGTFLLGWYTPTLGSVRLARLDSGGKKLGDAIIAGTGQSPAMAFGGGNFLVVWSVDQHCPGAPSGTSCVLSVRVSPAGKVLGPGKPAPLSVLQDRRHEGVSVAFDGARFLVVWADNRNGASLHDPATDIHGVRVDAKGAPLDSSAVTICAAAGIQQQPEVTYDGTDFVVVWVDLRHDPKEDLYGGRISGAGVVRDVGGVAISREATRELTPRLASDGAGHTLVVYARHDDSPKIGSQRVRGRLVSWTLFEDGFPCTSGADCKSKHCVDGVCCDKACGGSLLDCQACSVARGAAVDGVCGPVKAKEVCRAAAAAGFACDVAEQCDGAALVCPPDGKRPDGYPCPGGQCQKGQCLSLPDAGAPDGAATSPAPRGCSCEAAPAAPPWALGLALLLALLLALWRTRRPTPRR